MARLRFWPAGPDRDERPDRPFTGYKLAHAVLSADGTQTGFAGLTLGATHVYGVAAEATCVELTERQGVSLKELLEHHSIVGVLTSRYADWCDRTSDGRMTQDVIG